MKSLEYSVVLKYHDDKNICLVSLSLYKLERSATLSGEMPFLRCGTEQLAGSFPGAILRNYKYKKGEGCMKPFCVTRSRFAKNIEKYDIG